MKLTADERLKQHGLNAEERGIILQMAIDSTEIFAHTLPLAKMTSEEMWDRKMDYYEGFVDGMADAMSLILKNIKKHG